MSGNQQVIYTYGAFDLLHYGHIILLRKARSLGSRLIVGILSDVAIKGRKGDDRPIQSYKERSGIMKELKMVDEVVFQPTYDPLTGMRNVSERIDVITKGDDVDVIIEAAKKYGCGCVPLEYSLAYSTSDIIRRVRS